MTPPRTLRPPLATILAGAALGLAALGLAACDAGAPASGRAPVSGASASAPEATSAGGNATGSPAAPRATRSGAVEIDASLLAVLPETVEEFPVVRSSEVEQADLADPGIPREVRALAAAWVHDVELTNWAVATVVALEPGVLSDAFHESWRETFDAGACAPAGGVTGSAQATIANRSVIIGRCAAGVLTYHVRLRGDRLVSITAVGERRFGEQLVSGLRD